MENPRVTAVHTETIGNIIQLALSTPDLATLRACTSAVLDYVFFNRAISGHLILPGDISVATDVITFRERTTKRRRGGAPGQRICTFNTRGNPHIPAVFRHWMNAQVREWRGTPVGPDHFWRLPGKRAPVAMTISHWFSQLMRRHPELSCIPHRHHDLRAGGASACFALDAPEAHIRAWGDWAPQGRAFWRYIDVMRQPTEADFRLFGWMTITARDLHTRLAHIFVPSEPNTVSGQVKRTLVKKDK